MVLYVKFLPGSKGQSQNLVQKIISKVYHPNIHN